MKTTQRALYLVCYDITQPRRLTAARRLSQAYCTGGQKSVHELLMSHFERDELLQKMRALLEPAQDRLMLIRLDARNSVHMLGKILKPLNSDFFYVG